MLMVLPKVTCPVCQAETKESKMIPEAMAGARMCYRCTHYLAPEKGGTDHGLFMVQIEVRAAENLARAMDHAVMLAKTWKMEGQG